MYGTNKPQFALHRALVAH